MAQISLPFLHLFFNVNTYLNGVKWLHKRENFIPYSIWVSEKNFSFADLRRW